MQEHREFDLFIAFHGSNDSDGSKIDIIHANTINLEKSTIPQILYCLIRSNVLDN